MKINVRAMILCAIFAALIIVGTFIKIPVPPVPLTMQTFFVILSGLILGHKYGAISVLVYIALGLAGLPVFSGGNGGVGSVLMPTFGYLIGFVIAAYTAGKIKAKSFKELLFASFVCMCIIYICGAAYYYIMQLMYFKNEIDIKGFIFSFFILSLPKDMVVCFLCAFFAKRIRKVTKTPDIRC